jgi:hypothetical protein
MKLHVPSRVQYNVCETEGSPLLEGEHQTNDYLSKHDNRPASTPRLTSVSSRPQLSDLSLPLSCPTLRLFLLRRVILQLSIK